MHTEQTTTRCCFVNIHNLLLRSKQARVRVPIIIQYASTPVPVIFESRITKTFPPQRFINIDNAQNAHIALSMRHTTPFSTCSCIWRRNSNQGVVTQNCVNNEGIGSKSSVAGLIYIRGCLIFALREPIDQPVLGGVSFTLWTSINWPSIRKKYAWILQRHHTG